MLSKLIRYELKATRRIFLPAYAVVLLLAILNSVFMFFEMSNYENRVGTPLIITVTVYILALFAVGVITLAYMISRFYKNLLGDEGYLMFTLPAKPGQLIWSKCLTSSLWVMCSGLVACLSLIVFSIPIISASGINWSMLPADIQFAIQSIWLEYRVHVIALPLLWILLGIVSITNFSMHVYACLSIGSLANKHRLGYSFLAYLGFGIVGQIILLIFSGIADILPFSIDIDLNGAVGMYAFVFCVMVWQIVKLLVDFLIANYILSKHLNLQ